MTKRHIFVATTALAMVLSTPAAAQQAVEPSVTDQAAAPTTAQQATTPRASTTDDDQNGTRVGDIVVTAQRRAERSQDVPIAISAFSADDLQTRGVTNALNLGQYVPNLVAQNNAGLGSANAYYLRGLGNTESIPTFDPPVGTYVDDIYLSRQNANNLNLFDVERVEVLRGPQGTLFGKNTTGGAISVILRQPGKTLGGYAEVGYGSFNNKLARASVDLPLADTFQVKVSGYWQNDDGYTKDTITKQRLNDGDGWGARLGLHGDLSSNVVWNASYTHIVDNSENILNFECNPTNPTDCNGRFSATGFSKTPGATNFAALGITGRKATYGQGNRTSTELATSNLQFTLSPALTLNLITGFVSQRQQYALDFYDGRSSPTLANPFPAAAGLARGGFVILNDGYEDQISQEVKVSGILADNLINYVAGFYYLHENNRVDFADVFAGALLLDDRILRNSTTDYAGYAQGDVNVTSKLKLTAGVRYTDETKRLDVHDNRAICRTGGALPASCVDTANLITATGVRIPTALTARVWTPRFAINYKASDGLLVYASATRGFKGGGWNARASAPSVLFPFDPEKVWSYEGGFKSDLFDRRVRFNLTGFWEEVTDLQTVSGFVNPATGALSFVTQNFANYRNRGIEAELTVVPTRGLNLYANGGYQKDKYVLKSNVPAFNQYNIQSVASQQQACLAQLAPGRIGGGPGTPACAAGIITAQGGIATPVRTPDFTVSLGGSYDAPLGSSGLSLTPSVNASWHSDQQVAASNLTIYSGSITGTNGTFPANPNGGNEITGALSKAAWILNASLSLNGPDKRWRLSAECLNCTNTATNQSDLGNFDYINPPRTLMARARYNF